MLTHNFVSYCDPLDLLHRFVPTPLRANVALEGANVILQTNDLSFLPSTARSTAAYPVNDQSLPSCVWKIVRDAAVRQDLTEASLVMCGNLQVYSMGPACIIAADREQREILGFIGASVDVRAFQLTLLPALHRLTEFVTRPLRSSTEHADLAATTGDQCNA